MKSHKLHKFLMLLMTIIASAWSQPLDIKPEALPTLSGQAVNHQPHLLIQNNVKVEDMKGYEIIIPKTPQQNEPCLTITWKTNPDGSGPDDPKIYFVDGYFRIMPSSKSIMQKPLQDQQQNNQQEQQ